MSGFERYDKFYESDSGTLLRPQGEAREFEFALTPARATRYRLFVTGETQLFYQWKDEPDGQFLYRSIADALDSRHAENAHFCLDFSSKAPVDYVRRAYKKLVWPPILSYLAMNPVPSEWRCGVYAKAEGLKLEEGGYLRLRVDVRYNHEGVNRRSVELEPDESYTVDLPEGSYGFTELSLPLTLERSRVASVGYTLEGVGYRGEVYFESPFLTASNGVNILPDFEMPIPDKPAFDWLGENLSRKEWPEFEVTLNGERVFAGEVFERCHRRSEWEIELPAELLAEENRLAIRLVSNYHDPLPYRVHELGIISEPDELLTLVSESEVGTLADGAYLLVRTREDSLRVGVTWSSRKREIFFEKAGLHGIHLECETVGSSFPFELECRDVRVSGEIARVVERESDGVVTGTGDLVYVMQTRRAMEDYLTWYVSNRIGRQLTVRPTYRWSGTRTYNEPAMQEFARVLDELGMCYPVMLDGRELPGMCANPTEAEIGGSGWLGRQTHEQDGSAFYWGLRPQPSLMAEQYTDLDQLNFASDPTHTQRRHSSDNYHYVGDMVYRERDPNMPRDYRIAAERSVAALARLKGDATRHTGPSVMFKYMFDAGYEWLGAETMYSSMEVLMAFLRGTSRSRGQRDFGVHHALQWSSSPQDAPEHVRRYRLALYVSWMLGASQINTEEGLWHLEEYYSHFHRHSQACKSHLEQQRDFARFVATHSRKGELVSAMGVLHGRYDGWHGFGNAMQWGFSGARNGDAERSWDLMRVFYPRSEPGKALYFHGCPTDRPLGYHSGAPLGGVDAIPVESGAEFLAKYPALAFMGYHMAGVDDEKLADYVRNGGKLLLTRAHLATATELAAIQAYELNENLASPLSFAEADEYVENHVNGIPVRAAAKIREPERVLAYTDEGLPLVCEYRLGAGVVTLVEALAYPAHPAIRGLYEARLEEMLREATVSREVWYESGDDVEAAVYDLEDGSCEVYFLAVDWYRSPELMRRAVLRVGEERYEIDVPFGVCVKCVVRAGVAVISRSEDGDVLELSDGFARVQGVGECEFTVAREGVMCEEIVNFKPNSVSKINIKKEK